MSLLFIRIMPAQTSNIILKQHKSHLVMSFRKLSIVPSIYDGDKDPAPKFFSNYIQKILKRLTRPDFSKVFRKRTSSGLPVLKTPTYKFLTTDELELELEKAHHKADRLLQMPPVLKVHKPVDEVLSRDPALVGYDTAKFLFTDITFGVANEHRLIIERDPDGSLRSCDHDVRKRLNQVYFPLKGRSLKEPSMFSDSEKFNSLLDREKYEFVLDRACIQYEPDEPAYQRITSITYQHVDMHMKYDLLRSTRHFGSLAFYLTWHQSMDSLMLELLQNGAVREAVLLTALRQAIHEDLENGDVVYALTEKIFPTPVQLTKPERLSEEDIELDNKCVECIEKYIIKNSSMKSQQELALQGFREYYQQIVELSRGLQKAHGKV